MSRNTTQSPFLVSLSERRGLHYGAKEMDVPNAALS